MYNVEKRIFQRPSNFIKMELQPPSRIRWLLRRLDRTCSLELWKIQPLESSVEVGFLCSTLRPTPASPIVERWRQSGGRHTIIVTIIIIIYGERGFWQLHAYSVFQAVGCDYNVIVILWFRSYSQQWHQTLKKIFESTVAHKRIFFFWVEGIPVTVHSIG